MKTTIPLFILSISSFLFIAFNKPSTSLGARKENFQSMKLMVGTYTGQGSHGIYLLNFDAVTGLLSDERLLVEADNPSFLTCDRQGKFVYSVNEGNEGKVSSFRWNGEKNSLLPVNQQLSQGSSPCSIALNAAEDLLAVANYGSGTVSVYHIGAEGMIQADPKVFQHEGQGPVLPSQKGPRAHCVVFDPNGKFLYAVDLGIDQIITYPVSASGVGTATSRIRLDPGDGPRHFIFDPVRDLAYVVNELSSSVVSMRINHNTGELVRLDKKSTLPEDFTGKNYCADIHISSDGRFLYASNRGHNSLVIYKVDTDGMLTRVGTELVRGEWPRNFTLSPDEKYVLVANQNTNNITVFNRSPETGLLTYTGHQFTISKPVALKFLN